MMVIFLRYILVLVLVAATVTCASYYKDRSEKISATTESLLQSNDFERIYESLNNSAKSLTPKPEFNDRANRLVALMREADPEMKFVKSHEGGVNPDAIRDMYCEYRSLGIGTKQIDVVIWISLSSGFAELYDVCVNPADREVVNTQHCLTNALRKI